MRDEHADACKCGRCSGKVVYFGAYHPRVLIAAVRQSKRMSPDIDDEKRLADMFSRINPTC